MEITCRLECISAAAKWSPGRHMRPIKQWATQIFLTTGLTGKSRDSLAKVHVRIFGYQNIQFWFQYFYVGHPKINADYPGYHLGGPLGEPGFVVSCSTGACMM